MFMYFQHFQPINLCNVTEKFITKLVANNLRHVLPKLIHPSQTSFMLGRNIIENIIITQKVIHTGRIKKEVNGNQDGPGKDL